MNWQFFEQLCEHKHSSAYRAVGLVLAIRAKDDDPVCWPSITSLCKDASVCRQTAIRAINQFEGEGLLKVERKGGRVNRYRLTSLPSRRDQFTTETGQDSGTSLPSRRDTSLRGRRDQSTQQTRKNTLKAPKQEKTDADVTGSEVPY